MGQFEFAVEAGSANHVWNLEELVGLLYFVGADLRYCCLLYPDIRLGLAVLDRRGELHTDDGLRRRSVLRGIQPDEKFKLTHYRKSVSFDSGCGVA